MDTSYCHATMGDLNTHVLPRSYSNTETAYDDYTILTGFVIRNPDCMVDEEFPITWELTLPSGQKEQAPGTKGQHMVHKIETVTFIEYRIFLLVPYE